MDTLPYQTCYRHADRRAGVACQRCDRPICPDCMTSASVGFQCPQCAGRGSQRVVKPAARWSGGGTLNRPIVALSLIVVNVAVFMGDMWRGARLDGALIGRAFSVRQGDFVGVAEGEWWRLLTSGFLHVNLIHLGFNMFALWVLAQVLEPELGRLRFGLLYFTSMLAGGFGVLLLNPNQPTVGASGAVFGLFGALAILQLSRGISPFETGLGTILIINLIITFVVPNISIGGHLGGLAGGAVAGLALFGLPSTRRTPPAAVGVAGLVALAVVVTAGALWAAGQPGLLS